LVHHRDQSISDQYCSSVLPLPLLELATTVATVATALELATKATVATAVHRSSVATAVTVALLELTSVVDARSGTVTRSRINTRGGIGARNATVVTSRRRISTRITVWVHSVEYKKLAKAPTKIIRV
jgi:hypothetical protein